MINNKAIIFIEFADDLTNSNILSLSHILLKRLPKKELSRLCINKLGISLVIDVVCGMEIDEKTSKWKSEFKGKTYYFCGPMCKIEFDENPEKYVSDARNSLNK